MKIQIRSQSNGLRHQNSWQVAVAAAPAACRVLPGLAENRVIRLTEVVRARQLIRQPDYPSRAVLELLAGLLAGDHRESPDRA